MLNCPICKKTDVRTAHALKKDIVVNCDRCDFYFVESIDAEAVDRASASAVLTKSSYKQELHDRLFDDEFNNSINLSPRILAYERKLKKDAPSILEVGCGTGVLAQKFVNAGFRYTGIDIDENMIRSSQSRGIDSVSVADFMNYTPSEKFDIVFASQVLEHMIDPSSFVGKAHSILREGGFLHVDVPHHYSLAGRINKVLKRNPSRYGGIEVPFHQFSYTKKAMHTLFDGAGLVPEVFCVTSGDKVWGQYAKPNLKHHLYYLLSGALGSKNLLVGIGRKPVRSEA